MSMIYMKFESYSDFVVRICTEARGQIGGTTWTMILRNSMCEQTFYVRWLRQLRLKHD